MTIFNKFKVFLTLKLFKHISFCGFLRLSDYMADGNMLLEQDWSVMCLRRGLVNAQLSALVHSLHSPAGV